MLENLSNNFKKVFEYLKSKGIHEIWVSKDVDFSSEYPVGSIYIISNSKDVDYFVYDTLTNYDSEDVGCSIAVAELNNRLGVDLRRGKRKVIF